MRPRSCIVRAKRSGVAALSPQGADVQVLIVESNRDLARIWSGFLARQGMTCVLAEAGAEAYAALRARDFDALVLDMELPEGEALRVADFATYRNPDIPIIAVTARGFFSDGAIFELIPNARGLLRAPLRPEDMAALVEHYAARSAADARRRAAAGG
jgi:DNA-binding NtrC family response regulator